MIQEIECIKKKKKRMNMNYKMKIKILKKIILSFFIFIKQKLSFIIQ